MRKTRLILFVIIVLLVSCKKNQSFRPYSRSIFLMDTYVTVSVYEPEMDNVIIERAIDSVFSFMKKLEISLSAHVQDSDISMINKFADLEWVEVSDHVYDCLKKCVNVSEISSGSFDICTGIIKQHWCFRPDSIVIPDSLLIQSLLPKVDYTKIQLEDNRVHFAEIGMKIDLGAAAKGYIIDMGMLILQEAGICSAIIEGGGDFRIIGSHPERDKWRIGVRHPRKEGIELAGVLKTEAKGIATSGDYERYFFQAGKRYHHIFNPETGYPARPCISVTITAESAFFADALATAVFAAGPGQGMNLIKKLDSIEGLIIYQDGDGDLQFSISDKFLCEVKL